MAPNLGRSEAAAGRPHARAHDFFKAALPGQFIFAVGLREGDAGAVDPDLAIAWPKTEHRVMSSRDQALPTLRDIKLRDL